MKNFNLLSKAKLLTLIIVLALGNLRSFATGITYTALATGNWSDANTWVGGVAPSFTLSGDIVVIPTGITVTLDNSASISTAPASITVNGTLTSNGTTGLTLNTTSLSGTGTLTLYYLTLNANSTSTFSGTAAVNTLTSASTLQWVASTTISQALNISSGTFTLASGGGIGLAAGATITLSGGTLVVTGGLLNLTSSYNVVYTNGSQNAGVELTGTGLNNVTVNLLNGNTLSLAGNQTVNGTFTLSSGTLVLAGHNLTLNGPVVASNGYINSTSLSDIAVNNSAGVSGNLRFTTGSRVNNFTVAVGNSNTVSIDSLIINGTLALNSGTFNFNALTLKGSLTGTGMLSSDSTGALFISNTTGISTPLNFLPGQSVGVLSVSVGAGNSVTLGSSLTVADSLLFSNNSILNIDNVTITINGNIAGIGSFATNSSSGIEINSTSPISAPIVLSGSAIDTFLINTPLNTITLGSNLNVTGLLQLDSSTTLNLNGHDLTLTGTCVYVGGGYEPGFIESTSSSNITYGSTASVNGMTFTNGSQVNNFTINVGSGTLASIENLEVTGTLALTSGNLYFSYLVLDGQVTGTGQLRADGYSGLTVNTPHGISTPITFMPDGDDVGNFTINIDSGSSVKMGSNLVVHRTLSLSNGSALDISGDTLYLNSGYAGTGKLITTSSTDLELNGNIITAPLIISGNLGVLLVNVGNGRSATLGDSLHITSLIALQSGELITAGNNLVITGNIAANDSGFITADTGTDITINYNNSLSGGLAFSTGGNSVTNLYVNTPGSLVIQSNLNVLNTVTLAGGKIDIGNDTLTLAEGGHIVGADSSRYIIATDSGALALSLTAGDTSWSTFQIGTDINYAPVALQLNAGSTGGYFYGTVKSGVFAQGTTGYLLSDTQAVANATWLLEPAFATAINANIRTTFSSTIGVNGFNADSAYIAHYTLGQWDSSLPIRATAQAGTYLSLQRNGLTSFSPFAVFSKRAGVDTIGDTTHIPTAVIGIDKGQIFEIYPNPASQNIIINNVDKAENVWVEIINLTGQVMARYQLTNYVSTINLDNLSAGNYFIKLYSNNINETRPFVKM